MLRSQSNTSDRWSKTSSDSDASLIFGVGSLGDLRFDSQKASDLEDLLLNVAQISGGYDRKGYLFITILKSATQAETSCDDIKKVVLYLASTRSVEEKQHGFSFLVFLQPTPPLASIKPFAKLLQDYFPFKVSCIYVIKPEGYKDRYSAMNSGKYRFEVNFVTKETIFKYVSPDNLPIECGGTYNYNHQAWFKMRLAFEKFLFESMALSSALENIKRSLLQDDFSITVEGVRKQIDHHKDVRKWIEKIPIDRLSSEGSKVIDVIKTTCNCSNENDLKDEYKNSMFQVHSMLNTLQSQIKELKDLWQNRRGQLEQRFQLNLFKQDSEKLLQWIQENRTEFLCNYTEIGDDLEYAEELRQEHKQFEENCGDVQRNIDAFFNVSTRLHDMQFFDVELIDRLTSKLDTEWKKLYMAVERRSMMLDASVSFHLKSEEYLTKSKLWLEDIDCNESRLIDNDDTLNKCLSSHYELKQIMTESYDKVNIEAKSLLSALQRSPANDSRDEKVRSRLSDYTEAASHVMDVIVEMYEQNKQLNILWDRARCRMHQKHKFSMFKKDCDEIIKYLGGNGNAYLSKGQWVGDSLEIAEELLADQDEFEKSFQGTYVKAKKLFETAAHLAEKKECDPQEIKNKASQVEAEVKIFTSKIKKRRELLKMAVKFFKDSQKLAKSTDKLKDDLNLDSANESQNFDQQLEKHRHECETTLEQLLSTVQEGEKLSSELLQESRLPEKDSRTSWFSTGSNSPEQSRLAVELYLKELNVNRAQLQKLWRGRQQKLDYWVKVKHYERDTNQLYVDMNKWNALWQRKELANDVKKATSMVERFENEYSDISERFLALLVDGKELENLLQTCGVEVTIALPDNVKVDSSKHVAELVRKLQLEHDVIRKINQKLKVKYEFCLKQRKLEGDAKKVSSWIRHGASILEASHEAGTSMFEAESLLREYERFHVAIETTRIGVMDVRVNCEKLKRDGHPDSLAIGAIADDVDEKWHQLMQRAEDRRAVVFASYNFYRASEQVLKLLDKFSKDCKTEEDPCAKFITYPLKFKQEKIESIIKNFEPERKAVEDGCLKVRECSEEFRKQVLPTGDGTSTPIIEGSAGRLEITVYDLVEHVTSQEAFVLKQLQLRKTVLQGCMDYAHFQEDVEEVLNLLTEQGTVVSEGLKSIENLKTSDDPEEQATYTKKHNEYQGIIKVIRERVKSLLNIASNYVNKIHFHRKSISELANAIDTRFKDLLLPEFADSGEWPSLSALKIQSTELSAVTRRDVSNDSGIHEMTDERRRSVKRIEFIIKELIQTERAYVDDLDCCIKKFLLPTFNNPELPEKLQGQQKVIFGNIELIHEFHSRIFLKCLEKYEHCAENVGVCFVDWAEKFHMYVDFCANKPESNTLLIEHGENFFEELQQKQGLGLSLAAYLIKPVQRITKYQLLLKELLSCCDGDKNLQKGLDVMLSVPRRANDAMYLCMIKGFDEGSLETLGKILLQDSFSVWDTKHILKKGKERHVFLFEQALLFCKEVKDTDGKCMFTYKFKMKTNELGLTEHLPEDPCKFAVWTGEPPFTEEKRVIKAESVPVKQMWIREIRQLIQEFQFGMLTPQASFYPASPKKQNGRKSTSTADINITSDSLPHDCMSGDFDTATICSRTSLENYTRSDTYVVTDDVVAKAAREISLIRGQSVEVLSRPPGSRSWRVRIIDDVTGQDMEGMVPHNYLRKIDDSPMRGKRNSVETLNSVSSEDSYQQDSPKGSVHSVNADTRTRRRTKSEYLSGTLKMKNWSRSSGKKFVSQRPPLPTTPTRAKNTSGGGSKKLQAIFGAPKLDIELLIRPSDGKYATIGRHSSRNAEKVKFLQATDHEDAGFQEGEYDSDGDSTSDANDAFNSTLLKEDVEERALAKRHIVLMELLDSERNYIQDLNMLVTKIIPQMNRRSNVPEELKGKDDVIIGNMPTLLSFHQGEFLAMLEECENSLEKLASIFINCEKQFERYIPYCANKPRSIALVHDHLRTFFDDITAKENSRLSMEEHLLRPVERIMKYHAMLKDFIKYTSRAGVELGDLPKALHIMHVIPKKADDVMNVGMLSGFPGNLNNQGLLLLQDTVVVADVKLQEEPTERRLFLFEKMLIFSEPFQRKTNVITYIFRHCVPSETIGLADNYEDDPCKLAVWSKKENGSSEIYLLTARSANSKKQWIDCIRKLIEDQYEYGKDIPAEISRYLNAFKSANTSVNGDEEANSIYQHRNSGEAGQTAPAGQVVDNHPSTLQHVKLIPLDEAKSHEDLTKPFSLEKYFVIESYQKQRNEEMSVSKNDVVYLVNRAKKNSVMVTVKNFAKEKSGLVPSRLLKKVVGEESTLVRSSSFNEKSKKDRPKKAKTITSVTLLRTASLRRKKKKEKNPISEISSPIINETNNKSVLDRLQQHWNSNFDSSDDDIAAAESIDKILNRDQKTTFEVAPEFKILPRDTMVDSASHIKLTCTVIANPPPEVAWTKNEHLQLRACDKYRITLNNHVCTFEIHDTHTNDSGTYTVTATNPHGSASCSAKIIVVDGLSRHTLSKPIITSVTSHSVTLKWSPPEQIAVVSYSLQMQEPNCADWRTVSEDCRETSVIVDKLISGNLYKFRVIVFHATGSDASEVSEPVEILPEKNYKMQRRPSEIKWREHFEKQYTTCSDLGCGRFSTVKRCVRKETEAVYAAKFVTRARVTKEMVESEVAVLQSLNHPGIVQVFEIYEAHKSLVIVLQMLSGGRLFDHTVVMDLLTEKMVVQYVRQLLSAIQYIHSLSIAHLDIKPENILLSGGDDNRVVITDFGDAIRLRSMAYQHTLNGNPEFAAPEIINGENVSLSTDMWSVGVFVYVLLSGVSPFFSDNTERLCENITEIRYKFPEDFFADISYEAKDFIEELLVRNQSLRPDTAECLQFPWLRMSDPPERRISLSRLAAFNARRHYQYDSTKHGR